MKERRLSRPQRHRRRLATCTADYGNWTIFIWLAHCRASSSLWAERNRAFHAIVRLPGSSLARELGGIQSRDVDCSGHKAQQDWSFLGFFVWLANFFFFGFLMSKRGVLGACMHCLIHSWGFDSFVRICFLSLHSLLPFLLFEPLVSRASVQDLRPICSLFATRNHHRSFDLLYMQ